jgi:hypothetical protein
MVGPEAVFHQFFGVKITFIIAVLRPILSADETFRYRPT